MLSPEGVVIPPVNLCIAQSSPTLLCLRCVPEEEVGSTNMESLANIRRRVAQNFREHPTLWTVLNPPYRATLDAVNELRLLRSCRQSMTFDAAKGNDLVREAIGRGKPLALGKVGSLEAEMASCFLRGVDYPIILRQQLLENVGLHPPERTHLDRFCEVYLQAADSLDIMAAQGHPGETTVINRIPSRPLVRLRAFESWRHPRPWSMALAGKRVLVVSPFANTVMSQFRRRAEVWRDQSVLPPFELVTVRMPLSPGLVAPIHENWRERLDALYEECSRLTYDVMLVGAGGLSLPLVAHAKANGKIGFHLGGHTQILFGVYGRRWEADHVLGKMQTEAWVRPSGDEAPPSVVKVEQGCYW